jgi:hypothetical protein
VSNLATLVEKFNVDVLDHLDREADVPVLTEPQAQGDVLVVPGFNLKTPPTEQVPAEGVAVIRGEGFGGGGNTHLLLGSGDVTFRFSENGEVTVGQLRVAEGSEAYLAHPEHGYLGIGPGDYTIRRQRQFVGNMAMPVGD